MKFIPFLFILTVPWHVGFCQIPEPASQLYINASWRESVSEPPHLTQPGWIWIRDGKIADLGYGTPPSHLFSDFPWAPIDLHGLRVDPGRIKTQSHLLLEGLRTQNHTLPNESEPWRVSIDLEPQEISQALLKAQELDLSQGITTVQDHTLDANVMAKLRDLDKSGLLKLRVWSTSYGPWQRTRQWMKSIDGNFFDNRPDRKLHYYGDFYPDTEALSSTQIKMIYSTAGNSRVDFQAKSPQEALRIANLRNELHEERKMNWGDIIRGDFDLSDEQQKVFEAPGIFWFKDPHYSPALDALSSYPKVGKIAPGYEADLIFYSSDFKQIEKTVIHGETAYDRSAQKNSEPSSQSQEENPNVRAFLPLVGYDPSIGFLAGAAFFSHPYSDFGRTINVRAVIAPLALNGYLDFEWIEGKNYRTFSPLVNFRVNSLSGRYFGYGDSTTNPNNPVVTQPLRIDLAPGTLYRINPTQSLQISGLLIALTESQSNAIITASGSTEGPINGLYAGTHLEWVWDERDSPYSPRTGGKRVLWTESWWVQAGLDTFAQKVGIQLSQFFPLGLPNWVLGLRLDGAALFGTRSYLTSVTLGGPLILRGYLTNRFRGEDVLSTAIECRYPIWNLISGAVFTEVGRVWAATDPNPIATLGGLHPSVGAGLRIGLPPDFLIKARLDYAIGLDENAFYFVFNEAF